MRETLLCLIVGFFFSFFFPLVSGSDEVVEKCICILQNSCINVHSIEGKDYIAALPFQVSAACFLSTNGLVICLHTVEVGRCA